MVEGETRTSQQNTILACTIAYQPLILLSLPAMHPPGKFIIMIAHSRAALMPSARMLYADLAAEGGPRWLLGDSKRVVTGERSVIGFSSPVNADSLTYAARESVSVCGRLSSGDGE